MKKIYSILVFALLLLSGTTAEAQFGTGKRFVNTVEVVYSPVTFHADMLGVKDYTHTMNAVSLDWTQAYSIVESFPLYIQYGAVLQYSWGASEYFNKPLRIFSVNLPVSLAYDLAIPNTKISLVPYAGLNFMEHIIGRSGETNLFDEDEMAGYPFDDLMIGWQAGAKFVFDRYLLGVSYQGPLTDLFSDDGIEINLSYINISLGMRF